MFSHSPVDGQVRHFHLWAIVNNAAVNMGVQIPLWVPAFTSSGFVPRGAIAGSHGKCMFNFLRRGTAILFSVVAVPFYASTSNV